MNKTNIFSSKFFIITLLLSNYAFSMEMENKNTTVSTQVVSSSSVQVAVPVEQKITTVTHTTVGTPQICTPAGATPVTDPAAIQKAVNVVQDAANSLKTEKIVTETKQSEVTIVLDKTKAQTTQTTVQEPIVTKHVPSSLLEGAAICKDTKCNKNAFSIIDSFKAKKAELGAYLTCFKKRGWAGWTTNERVAVIGTAGVLVAATAYVGYKIYQSYNNKKNKNLKIGLRVNSQK